MGEERRTDTRHAVFGGNAEITSVMGRGQVPGERSRLVNWSQGGLCLKVKSPRRRFLFQKLDPVLWEDDSVVCTLRFPPAYKEVTVAAEVVHSERCSEDPDLLTVGLRFDTERTPESELRDLARSFEPKSRSGRLKPQGDLEKRERMSERLQVQGETPRRKSRRSRRASKRLRPEG